MPKKSKGANNTRAEKRGPRFKRMPLQYADVSLKQQYATITGVLGNCHFKVKTLLNEEKVGSLSGCAKRAGRVKLNDYVLIEPISEDENGKYHIIQRYTPEQVKQLDREGHIKVAIDPTAKEFIEKMEEEDNDGFMFANEEDEKKIAYEAMLTGQSSDRLASRVYQEADELEMIKEQFGTAAIDDI